MSSVSRVAARFQMAVERMSMAPLASESPQVFFMFKKQNEEKRARASSQAALGVGAGLAKPGASMHRSKSTHRRLPYFLSPDQHPGTLWTSLFVAAYSAFSWSPVAVARTR